MIVAVRHARVWNPGGVVYASLPGFHLADDGRQDAESFSRTLAPTPVRAIYSSPLDRAVETAEILARPHDIAVRTDSRLIEWSFWSNWQGMRWDRIRERDADRLDAYSLDPARACPEDPLGAVGERILAWAAEAHREHPDGLVLGVSHEAPMLAALLVGNGRGVAGFHSTNLPHLGTVRLLPGPAEALDVVAWAASW